MKRRCANCGEALAKGANFCRACGAPYAAPEPQARAAKPQAGEHPAPAFAGGPYRARAAILTSVVILVIGAGAAAAILLGSSNGSSSTTTVVRDAAAATPSSTGAGGSIEAGRYIQAGSFQTTTHAEVERRRLAGHGLHVEVLSSDGAEELYPGFQVLLGGPLRSRAAEARMLQGLHRNGVPSAFARELTPAQAAGPATGRWTGEVERTSAEHPNLDGTLSVALALTSDGTVGSLDFSTTSCQASLSLTSTSNVLTYRQEPRCAGAETLYARVLGDEVMLTLLSPDTDSFALGTLRRG